MPKLTLVVERTALKVYDIDHVDHPIIRVGREMGLEVVIDNVAGANGALAARATRTATPDGHTLLWGVGSMVALPLLQKSAAVHLNSSL